MVFPLFALLTATVAAREVIKLFGVGDLEEMTAFLAAQGDLRFIESVEDLEAAVRGNFSTLLVELGTLAAPGAIFFRGLWQAVYRYVEGVKVDAAEFNGILALADAVAA